MARFRKISVITKKLAVAILMAGFMLCSLMAFVGHRIFSRQFRIQYDSNIRAIASAARECLNPDDFENYIATCRPDSAYEGVQKILQDFVDKFDLNMLYVSYVEPPDYSEITYIYNPVMKGGRWSQFPLGYHEKYIEPSYNKTAKLVFEKGEIIVRHTVKTRSGSHITAMVPVYDSKGRIVAVLGAQKSIQEFVDSLHSYMRDILVLEFIFAAVFFLLFTLYFNLSFIRPLSLITHETDHFASYGGEPSDMLLTIKNQDEIGTLAHSVHQMELDVCDNIEKLTKITAEQERISTELNVATKIQREMLPLLYPPFPDRSDFDLYASMTPAKEVGGDLYDYVLLDDDHLMIVVGDVSGKGVPAALFMVIAKTLLSSHGEEGLSPAEIFNVTNSQLCKGNETGLFVTCWLGILTFSTGELRFVNAGHPYPVVFHDNEVSYLKTRPNLVLAGMEGMRYAENSITLAKGDRIFIYTDGVTEATNSKKELFGDERLLNVLKNTLHLDAPKTLEAVQSAINEFVGEAEQFDDITMLDFIWQERSPR